jgi:hypothetical protein
MSCLTSYWCFPQKQINSLISKIRLSVWILETTMKVPWPSPCQIFFRKIILEFWVKTHSRSSSQIRSSQVGHVSISRQHVFNMQCPRADPHQYLPEILSIFWTIGGATWTMTCPGTHNNGMWPRHKSCDILCSYSIYFRDCSTNLIVSTKRTGVEVSWWNPALSSGPASRCWQLIWFYPYLRIHKGCLA